MVDLIKEILIKTVCYECEYCGTKCTDYERVENHIKEGFEEWLSSFDTSSATKCFEAVNLLKERLSVQILCDRCGFIKTAIEGHAGQYHYCPNCGAEMSGGGDD